MGLGRGNGIEIQQSVNGEISRFEDIINSPFFLPYGILLNDRLVLLPRLIRFLANTCMPSLDGMMKRHFSIRLVMSARRMSLRATHHSFRT